VELAAFEQDKENVRPQRVGRSAEALAEVFCKSRSLGGPETLEQQRLARRAEFEANLARATAEAAAEQAEGPASRLAQLWFSFVAWAAEWYPSSPSEEQSILERATRALAAEPRSKEDIRHLQLWLRLADLQKEPQEVFSFLWANGIGSSHSLLFEAWATSLERQQRFGEAEEVVRVGLARSAQPANRLLSFQDSLAARMRQRVQRSAEEGLPFNAQQLQRRPMLNTISDEEAKLLNRPLERRALQPAALGQAASSASGAIPRLARSSFACLDEALEANELETAPRAFIFDAQADWFLPPVVEAEGQKENDQASAAAEFPWDAAARRRRQGAGAGARARAGGVTEAQRRPAARPPTATSAVVAKAELPVFDDFAFEDCGYGASAPSTASGTSAMHLSSPARSRHAADSGCTPPARRHRGNGFAPLAAPLAVSQASIGFPSLATSALVLGGFAEPQRIPDPEARHRFLSSEAMTQQATPGAPLREPRRRPRPRAEDEEDSAAAALATSLSSLRLRDEPPAKRICLGTVPSSSSQPMAIVNTSLSSTIEVAMAAQQALPQSLRTPPRRPGSTVRVRLSFDADCDLAAVGDGGGCGNGRIRGAARSPSFLCGFGVTAAKSCSSRGMVSSSGRGKRSSPISGRSSSRRGTASMPWESDPGFLRRGEVGDGGLAGLAALGSLFKGQGSGRDFSCSRLLIFEDHEANTFDA